ncbi:MAG TPA: hypothetical protein VGB04_01900 [Allosphingosinicella sp.]
MNSQEHLLKSRFETLHAATIGADSERNLVSVARKRSDCITDTFGGTRCDG